MTPLQKTVAWIAAVQIVFFFLAYASFPGITSTLIVFAVAMFVIAAMLAELPVKKKYKAASLLILWTFRSTGLASSAAVSLIIAMDSAGDSVIFPGLLFLVFSVWCVTVCRRIVNVGRKSRIIWSPQRPPA